MEQQTSTTSSFTVSCPKCAQRLRFLFPPGPQRVRVRCSACSTLFGVRRPGAPAHTVTLTSEEPPTVDGLAIGDRPTQALTGPPPSGTIPLRPGEGVYAGTESDGAALYGGPMFAPGDVLADRYCIVRFLAQGGMGEVYEAEDLELQDKVALKTVRAELASTAVTLDRFRREIQLARKVTHPNVCRIFDVSHHRGANADEPPVVFLTMELLPGETLSRRLKRGRLLPSEIISIARQIAQALDAAHQAGVIHRDLKPGNVVLVPRKEGPPRAVVTDFGLARMTAQEESGALTLTTADTIVGTPAYLAPEQLEGAEMTPAVDVYAFGIVLYEMCTGTVPFLSDSVLTTAIRRLKEAPEPPRFHAPSIDPRWESAILRCLEREPQARYTSCLEAVGAATGETDFGALAAFRSTGASPLPAADSIPPLIPPPPRPEASSGAMRTSGGRRPTVSEVGRTSAVARAPVAAAAERRGSVQRLALGLLLLLVLGIGWFRYHQWRTAREDTEAALTLPAATIAPRHSVAVLGFKDLSGGPSSAWLSRALTEMLTTELGGGSGLRIVAAETVTRAKLELGLQDTNGLAADTLARLRSLISADYVVLGSYVALEPGSGGGSQLRVDVRVQDTAAGETTATAAQAGTQADLFSLVSRIGDRLRIAMGANAPADATSAAAQRAVLPSSSEAARLYSEGVDRQRRFDPVGARELLEKAVAADPQSAPAHAALAAAWSSLGYEAKARSEAKAAFDLSNGLPAADRLAIEGRYREAIGEWPQAADIDRRLWILFPDEVEYGLRFATASTNAGRPKEALAATRTLRKLPAPLRDDPRIDLAEAVAAGALGDFRAQSVAAARAAKAAGATGASLLVAQARLLECRAQRNLGAADPALAACADGQRLYAAAGDRSGVAEALTHAANVRFDHGDLAGAEQSYTEALATYREIGDRGAEAGELNNLAVIRKSRGDLDQAGDLYKQVLAVTREIGSRSGEGYALNNLGGVLLARGELDHAAELFRQCLAIRRELGDRTGEAGALDNEGVALRRRGDLATSQQRHEAALALRRATGQKIGEVVSLNDLASTLLERGDLGSAGSRFAEALQLAQSIGSQASSAYALFGQGEVMARQGRLSEAEARHQEALDLRLKLGERGTAAESRLALARLRLDSGDPAKAGVLAIQAAEELARFASPGDQGNALSVAAVAALASHDPKGATELEQRATSLAGKAEDARARLTVAVRGVRLSAATDPAGALAAAAPLLAEAERIGLVDLRLDLAILTAQLEARRGGTEAARVKLTALEKEANDKGFGLLARKAHLTTEFVP